MTILFKKLPNMIFNKTVYGVLPDKVQGLCQGIPYFRNFIQFHGTRVTIIYIYTH
jgi:hypothetical protein